MSAEELKVKGNEHFTRSEISLALDCYVQAAAQAERGSELHSSILLNIAACKLKTMDWEVIFFNLFVFFVLFCLLVFR